MKVVGYVLYGIFSGIILGILSWLSDVNKSSLGYSSIVGFLYGFPVLYLLLLLSFNGVLSNRVSYAKNVLFGTLFTIVLCVYALIEKNGGRYLWYSVLISVIGLLCYLIWYVSRYG